MIRIFYPNSIYKLLDALSKHKVYVVGGFVRDLLRSGHGGVILGRSDAGTPDRGSIGYTGELVGNGSSVGCALAEDDKPKDIDLVTKDSFDTFLPSIQVLSKKYHIMERYQAVQFSFEEYQVSLTRLRYDAICDGRQADVVFVDTLQEDVWRRDFTINSLFADEEGQVVDFLDGVQDLEKKIVRFIGDPETRIKEDLLRILRYVRFCSLLGASMDPHILDLMRPHIPQLESLSQDRLQHEIKKIRKLPLGQENLAYLKI